MRFLITKTLSRFPKQPKTIAASPMQEDCSLKHTNTQANFQQR